jgi:hypothetical protein
MHTFVVRLFEADDLTDLEGILEDPASGLRVTFHDAGELARSMRAATRRAGDPKAIETDAAITGGVGTRTADGNGGLDA